MELTPETVAEAVERYPDVQALSAVEDEHVDILPGMFASGDYGWRDAEWVVQWYYRRYLGAYPNRDRRYAEGEYGANDFEAIRDAIAGAVAADGATAKLDQLTALDGVEVPVGSAFLQFIDPDGFVVVGDRTWGVLAASGDLADPYPDPPSVAEYETYLDVCRSAADRCDCTLWDLYRAAWVLSAEAGDFDEVGST